MKKKLGATVVAAALATGSVTVPSGAEENGVALFAQLLPRDRKSTDPFVIPGLKVTVPIKCDADGVKSVNGTHETVSSGRFFDYVLSFADGAQSVHYLFPEGTTCHAGAVRQDWNLIDKELADALDGSLSFSGGKVTLKRQGGSSLPVTMRFDREQVEYRLKVRAHLVNDDGTIEDFRTGDTVVVETQCWDPTFNPSMTLDPLVSKGQEVSLKVNDPNSVHSVMIPVGSYCETRAPSVLVDGDNSVVRPGYSVEVGVQPRVLMKPSTNESPAVITHEVVLSYTEMNVPPALLTPPSTVSPKPMPVPTLDPTPEPLPVPEPPSTVSPKPMPVPTPDPTPEPLPTVPVPPTVPTTSATPSVRPSAPPRPQPSPLPTVNPSAQPSTQRSEVPSATPSVSAPSESTPHNTNVLSHKGSSELPAWLKAVLIVGGVVVAAITLFSWVFAKFVPPKPVEKVEVKAVQPPQKGIVKNQHYAGKGIPK